MKVGSVVLINNVYDCNNNQILAIVEKILSETLVILRHCYLDMPFIHYNSDPGFRIYKRSALKLVKE